MSIYASPVVKRCIIYSQPWKPLNYTSRGIKSMFQGKKQKRPDKVIYQDLNLPSPDNKEFEEGEFLPRKLTYMPPDLNINKPARELPGYYKRIVKKLTLYPVEEDPQEWTETPQYPPIYDETYGEPEIKQQRLRWYSKIRSLPTSDLKFLEIIDLMKHQAIVLDQWAPNYHYLPMYQHLTRTHLVKGSLPTVYDTLEIGDAVDKLRGPILDAVRCHMHESERQDRFEFRVKPPLAAVRLYATIVEGLIKDVNTVCQNILSTDHSHVLNAEVDYTPDVRSWWWQRLPRAKHVNYYKNKKNPICDQAIQYQSQAALHLRYKDPLPAVLSMEDPLCTTSKIPHYPCNPAKDGFMLKWKFLQSVPGYWSDPKQENYDFPFLSFLSRHQLKIREAMVGGHSYPDVEEFVDSMGVIHNFAWLNAIAGVHGFTPYDELTYPFVSQLIVTDGQFWSFFCYQLNTHMFHSDLDQNNRRNVCWSTGELKLYDAYENGEFKGVNDKVLEYLAKLFIRKPVEVSKDVQLFPYLGQDERTEDEIAATKLNLRRRYGQFLTYQERVRHHSWTVFPFEWIYMRNPKAPSTILWRMPLKWPKPSPKGYFTY